MMKGETSSCVEWAERCPREAALPDDEPDKLLHAAWLAGDQSAFEKIVGQHHARVARLAYRLLGWQGDADDVVQDVFLAALKKFSSFRGDASLSTWLTTITINVCRTYRRREMLRLRWWRSQECLREPMQSPGESWQDAETSECVRNAVRALPAKDREVIVLFYLEERTSAEIAKLLGTSANAVDIRLHRARERLRPLLKDWIEA